MVTPLTEEQKTAILQQSEGMNLEEKQAFADKIHTAQDKQAITDTNIPVQDVTPPATEVETTPVETGVDVTPVIEPVEVKTETPPVVTDTKTETKIEPSKIETTTDEIVAPQTIEEWKKQGSNITTLEDMIESKYNTVAENVNGVLTADIGGVKYEWNIDETGNPIKTKVGGENPDIIFAQLMAGQTISDTGIKTTKQYSTAKARYDITSKYVSMTEDQLYNAYVNGEINSKLEQDLVNNPFLAGAKEKYNQKIVTDSINNESTTILNAYNKANGNDVAVTEEKNFLQTLSDKILSTYADSNKDTSTFREYMDTNYPDLVTDTKALNRKNTDLKVLVDERDDRLENIIKENPGISINRATMLAARQNKDINDQIKSMSYEIGNLQGNINYQSTMADKEYGYELDRQSKADALLSEQRGMAFDILQTESARQFQTQQIADQRAYEASNKGVKTQIITDQATGKQQLINSQTGEVIKTYDTGLKDGIIAGGIPTPGTTGVTTPITTGTGNITQNYGATSQVTQDNVTLANGTIGTPGVDIDGAIGDPINSFSNGTVVGLHEVNESGGFGRRLVIKDEDGKLHVYNHLQGSNVNVGDTVKRGDVIAAMGNTGTVIAGEGGDGSHLDYRVSDNGSFALNGGNWIDPNQFMGEQVADTTTEFKQNSIPQYTNYLTSGKIGTNKDELAFIVKEFGSVENFKAQAEAYNNSENGPRQKELDKILTLKDKISKAISEDNSEALSNSVGTSQFTIGLTPQRRKKEAYLAEIQNFLDGKTLQQLIDVKAEGATFGALSNEELKMLQNSASTLNQLALRENEDDLAQITGFKGSEANFKAKVQETIDIYDEIIRKKEALIGRTQATGNTIQSASGNTYTY